MAIAYLLQKTPYVFPIVGGRKVEHLLANIEALDIDLTDEHIKMLESAGTYDPGFPGWLIVSSLFYMKRPVHSNKSLYREMVPVLHILCKYRRIPTDRYCRLSVLPRGSDQCGLSVCTELLVIIHVLHFVQRLSVCFISFSSSCSKY